MVENAKARVARAIYAVRLIFLLKDLPKASYSPGSDAEAAVTSRTESSYFPPTAKPHRALRAKNTIPL